MSKIYFLGREDREGLDRMQNQKRGLLTYDAEVGGWDNLRHNDNEPWFSMPDFHSKAELAILNEDEPALRVFDSRVELTETNEKEPNKDDKPWPTITYQVRFGSDQ